MTVATPEVAGVGAAGLLRGAADAWLAALRPRQWIKNLLLFAGLLFAAKLTDGERWLEAFVAFSAYCLVASAAYLVNDVADAEADRLHPVKRNRPIASREIAPPQALVLALVLFSLGACLAGWLGLRSLAFLTVFAVLQAAYSLWLKRRPFLDVTVIAGFFALRAAAGAAAVHVRISPWLLACTALLALFLALAKRRGELVAAGHGTATGRSALGAYSRTGVDRSLWATAALAITAYAAYTMVAHDSIAMVSTVPLVIVGLGRYLHLIYSHDLGEAPEHVLLSDRPLLATVAFWVAAIAIILGS